MWQTVHQMQLPLVNMVTLVTVFALVLGSALAVPLSEAYANGDRQFIGGSAAPPGYYPHQISLRTNTNSHFCGGSIISPNWVLTAAHCVYGDGRRSLSSMQVVVGTNYLHSGGVAHRVSRAIWHEDYIPQNNLNDIAVLALSIPITYNQVVQPIALATSTTPGGIRCTLSGWGLTTYPSSNFPNSLQHISLTSITVGQCQEALPGHPVYVSNVCTHEPIGRGACHGDSGGPLICGGRVQHGVVSWGIPCAKGNPDIFTSVAYYRNWIRSKTGV